MFSAFRFPVILAMAWFVAGCANSEKSSSSKARPNILICVADDASFQRAKTVEPFGYLIKPIDIKELNRVVEMALYKNKIYKYHCL